MIQSIVHFVSFLKSIERTNLLQKWLPYSDRFGVKKTFLVTLYNSSFKIHKYSMHFLSTYFGRSIKEACQASHKIRSNPRFSGPFPFFILLAASQLDFQRKREQTSGVVTSTKSGLLAHYSIPEHPGYLGWSQNRNL